MVRNSTIRIEKALMLFSFLLSSLALVGWIFNIPLLVRYIPEAPTIKFNTAFLAFLIVLIIYTENKKNSIYKAISFLFVGIVLIISTLSLIEYYLPINLTIDNYFILDTISLHISGRMSPSTSISFIFLSFGIICARFNGQNINKLCTGIFFIVFTIASASLIAYFLYIPINHRGIFFQTMSLPSTILFLSLSLLLMFKNPNISFSSIMNFHRVGSKLFWKIIPVVTILPILFSYILLYFSNEVKVNMDFGIAICTNIFILLSTGHLIYLSVQLNQSERERLSLQKEISILKENEIRKTLLKETHHRVKNNFQIINSVLGLQSNKSKNMELRMVLSDCQNRIRAIAALHESIYVNGNFEEVKLSYFLNNIVSSLVNMHSESDFVHVDISIPDIDLNMKYAMPLGLIINEVVTNSLKHAFFKQTNKCISVKLKNTGNDSFNLIISDNGIGCAEMANELLHPTSMGSELISIFTEQLNGKINVENEDGLTYYLSFKTNKVNLKIA